MDARHRSLWIATTPQTAFPTLDRDLDVDVAVVGGGIVGVTTAALLREAGARVALLEADRIVEGITGHTTAKLTVLHGTRLSDLLSRDEDRAHQYAEANQAGLDLVRRFVTDHWIDCELVETTMTVFAEDAEQAEAVEAEAEALRIVGLRPRHTPEARLPFPTTGAVTLPRQLSFHPRKYLLALAQALLEREGLVFERTRVTSLDEGARCAVATDSGHTVAADRVVLATGMPFLLRGLLFARATPSRGYAVAVDAPQDAPSGMFIAAGTPAHSIRDAHVDERRVLVLSGAGHHVGEGEVEERNWDELEAWGREHLGTGPARFRWSTQDWYPADGLPFVGRASPGIDDVLVATGFGGWGMSNGTTAASLLADLCLGRESPYESLYDPGRLDARDLRGALAKGVKDATRLTRGRLGSHPRLDEVEPVAPGGGAVVSLDGETIAISRLADGSLAAVSAVCTHLGCVVDWNQAEGSWDCPCHGSRFAPDGSVLTGPAIDPLADRSELLAELPGARRPA